MRVRYSRASGADEESALLRDADEDVNTRRWTRSRRIAVAVGGMCVVACGVVATMSGSLMGEGVGSVSSLATRFGGASRLATRRRRTATRRSGNNLNTRKNDK